MSLSPRHAAPPSTRRVAACAMACAVTLAALPGGAAAQITHISLDGYCVVTLDVFAWHQAGMSHSDCNDFYGFGSGMAWKAR